MRTSSVIILGVIAAAATFVPAAHADTITIEFTGRVVSATGIWAGQGPVVTGSYSYDDGLARTFGSVFTEQYSSIGAGNNLIGGWDITVTVGGTTRSTSTNHNTGSLHHRISVIDHPTADAFAIESFIRRAGDDEARFVLRDTLPAGAPEGVAPGSGGLNGTLPTGPFDPALFSEFFPSHYFAYDAQHRLEGELQFVIDSTRSRVPEPAGMVLLGLAAAGIALRRRRMT